MTVPLYPEPRRRRSSVVIGVDPGASGAIAVLSQDGSEVLGVYDMPYVEGAVIPPTVKAHLEDYPPGTAYVEKAQSMPGQGVSSTFKYGVGYGVVLGVLGGMGIPTHHVRPAVWKKFYDLSKDKGASRRRASELYPGSAHLFARVKDDGRAEAVLIARWGVLEGGNVG